MTDLTEMKCEACRVGAPLATPEQINDYLLRLPDWVIVEVDGVKRLEKTFQFNNFREALAFSNRVGSLAEAEGHHPAILTEWGQVTVRWWSHKIRGLHVNDFIMAAKTNRLQQSM